MPPVYRVDDGRAILGIMWLGRHPASAPIASAQDVFDRLEGQIELLQRQGQALIRQILLLIENALMRSDPHQVPDYLVTLMRFHVLFLSVSRLH